MTQAGNPRHLQLRTAHEIWHKENALNLMIQRLPAPTKYIVHGLMRMQKFSRPDWGSRKHCSYSSITRRVANV